MRNHADEVAHVADHLAMGHKPMLGSYLGIQQHYGTSSTGDIEKFSANINVRKILNVSHFHLEVS